jgi:hypothetical protein
MKKIPPLIIAALLTFSLTGQQPAHRMTMKNNGMATDPACLNLQMPTVERLDSTINYNWDDVDGWYPYSKLVKIYNADSNVTLQIDEIWNSLESKWDTSGNSITAIDERGNPILYVDSYWRTSQGIFVPGSKMELTYDEGEHVILALIFNWNVTDSIWDNQSKEEFEYDINGNRILEKYCWWNSSNEKWDSVTKIYPVTDTLPNATTELTESWRAGNNEWYISNRFVKYTDEHGNDTLWVSYNPLTGMVGWVPVNRNVRKFDDDNHLIFVEDFNWDLEANQWKISSQNEMTYNLNGNISTHLQYNYADPVTHQLSGKYKQYFFYSEYTVTSAPAVQNDAVYAWPNPASDYVVFGGITLSNTANIALYDMQGRKVLDKPLPADNQISLHGVSRGLYMFKVSNGKNVYSGKLIVQ